MKIPLRGSMNERDYRRLMIQKQIDGWKAKTLAEYLGYKFRQTSLNPSIQEQILRFTRSELAPMWMRNLAENLHEIRTWRARDLRDLVPEEPVDRKCVIVGRGPSLYKKKHLEMIRDSRIYQEDELVVVACDGILKDCLEAGVVPDYVTTVDGSDKVIKWYEGLDPEDLLRRNQSEAEKWWGAGPDCPEGKTYVTPARTRAVISSQANPGVAKAIHKAKMPLYWFQPASDRITEDPRGITLNLTLLTCSEKRPNGILVLDCGGQVGTMSWSFSWQVLKHKDVCLVGMDCGYPKDMPYDDTYYWEQNLKRIGAFTLSVTMEFFTNPFTGEEYYMDQVFRGYREAFMDLAIRKPQWLRLCNASSGTLFYPPYVESVHLSEWLTE